MDLEHALSLSYISTRHARNFFGRLWVIVKEKPLNLEKTTSIVLSVLFIIYMRQKAQLATNIKLIYQTDSQRKETKR